MSTTNINVSPQLYKAIKGANEAGAYFQEQVGKFTEIVNGAAEAQDKINALEAEYAEKKRVADLDLSLAVRADRLEAMYDIAKEEGFSVMTQEEHQKVFDSVRDVDTAVAKAIEAEKVRGSIALSSAVKNAQSSAALELAETKAELSNKNMQIQFLQEQIENLRNDARETRNTATQMVEAATRSKVNVSNSGK